MRPQSIIFALENAFLNTEQSIRMSIKNSIKIIQITVLRTIDMIYRFFNPFLSSPQNLKYYENGGGKEEVGKGRIIPKILFPHYN